MPQARDYTTAQGFRRALLAHLRRRATEQQVDPQRLQRLVAFDRFLARLFDGEMVPWIVKGGYALELRLPGRARTTKDIDLALPHPRELAPIDPDPLQAVRELLQDAAEQELDDHFTFRVGAPKQELDGPPYGGARFTVEARIGSELMSTFHLDVSIGDSVIDAAEWLTGEALLEFAGIPPVHVPVLPAAQQFVEKIHALTLPRGDQVSTRVKDLADLVLLIEMEQLDTERVAECLRATFARRMTHALPVALSFPPLEWSARYAAFADECGLQAKTLEEAFALLAVFWKGIPLS